MQTWLLRLRKLLFRKPKFRKWSELEDKKYEVIKAVEQGADSLYLSLYDYVSTALVFHPKDYSKVYWKDVIGTFLSIHNVTVPTKTLPLISKQAESKNKKDPWDYAGRLWFFYSSTIAEAFNWTIDEIASLPVDDALAYIQEILTEKQLEREFQWSAAEVAYSFNSKTKETKFHSLHRPYWMLPDFDEKKEVKTIKIPKSLLPVGTIINMRTNETEKTQPSTDK